MATVIMPRRLPPVIETAFKTSTMIRTPAYGRVIRTPEYGRAGIWPAAQWSAFKEWSRDLPSER